MDAEARRPERIAEDWAFASGRTAALETRMLPRAFFERALELSSLEDVLHSLNETPWSAAFAAPQELREADSKVRTLAASLREEMRRFCPDPKLADLLELPEEFRSLKSFVKRQEFGLDVAPGVSRYREETWAALWTGQETELPVHFQRAAAQAKAALGGKPKTLALLEAALDSARLTALCEAARETGSQFIGEYYRRHETAKGVELLWRGHIAGLDPKLQRLLLEGRQEPALFRALRESEETEWPALLASALEGLATDRLGWASGVDRIREFIRAADEWLMAFLRPARRVAFGAERVFGYLVGLDAEAFNLTLCLSGRAYGIEPEVLRDHLRACYT